MKLYGRGNGSEVEVRLADLGVLFRGQVHRYMCVVVFNRMQCFKGISPFFCVLKGDPLSIFPVFFSPIFCI